MQTTENREPTLSDVLFELRSLKSDVESLKTNIVKMDERLADEVKRWDDRFFKFAEDSANRANTLIAGATISVITGVVFLLLRQQ
jgi:hypothetical protein